MSPHVGVFVPVKDEIDLLFQQQVVEVPVGGAVVDTHRQAGHVRGHDNPPGALGPPAVDRRRDPVEMRIAGGVHPLSILESQCRGGTDHPNQRIALRQVHVVLAPVGPHDPGTWLGRQALKSLMSPSLTSRLSWLPEMNWKGNPSPYSRLHIGAPRGLGDDVPVREIAQGQGGVRCQRRHSSQDRIGGSAGSKVTRRDKVDLVGRIRLGH